MGIINDNLHVAGTLSCATFNPPDRSIGAAKVIHQFPVRYSTVTGADVATATEPVHILHKDATLVGVKISCSTAPVGGLKLFTVDVQKGNQGGAFATMLTAPVTIDTSVDDREVVAASLATDVLSEGDTLRVVVTASGATGSQGQGLIVDLMLREDPE